MSGTPSNDQVKDSLEHIARYIEDGSQQSCHKLKSKLLMLVARIDARFVKSPSPPKKFGDIIPQAVQIHQQAAVVHDQTTQKFDVEHFSQLPMNNIRISHDKLKSLLNGVQIVKLDAIVPSQKFLNWVTFGVVVNIENQVKVTTKGTTFQQISLSLLDKVIAPQVLLFMHDGAQEKSRSLRTGQIILVSAPDVLPPTDKVQNSVALSVKREDQFIVLGEFPYLGVCKGTHKITRAQCTSIINTSINGYCHYHVAQAKKKVLQQRPHMTTTTKVDEKPKSANGVYFMNGSLQNTKQVTKSKEASQQQLQAESEMLKSFMKADNSLGSKYVKVVQDGVQEKELDAPPLKSVTDLRQLLKPAVAQRSDLITLEVSQSSSMKSIVQNVRQQDLIKRKQLAEDYQKFKQDRQTKKLKAVMSDQSNDENQFEQKAFYCETCTKLTAIYPKECYQNEHSVQVRTLTKSLWQCSECPEVTQDTIGTEKPLLLCKGCQANNWIPSHIKITGPLHPI